MISAETAKIVLAHLGRAVDKYGPHAVLVVVVILWAGYTIEHQNEFIQQTLVGLVKENTEAYRDLRAELSGRDDYDDNDRNEVARK